VVEYADRVAEGEVTSEEVMEVISVPGVPEDVEAWEDYEGWTAGKVWASIEAIAKATGEDPDELLEYATDAARRDIIGKEQACRAGYKGPGKDEPGARVTQGRDPREGGPLRSPPLPRPLQGDARVRSTADETSGRIGSFGPPRR
jgi:hypothetical protein